LGRKSDGFVFAVCLFVCLALDELLATLASLGDELQHVVADRLGEGTALADNDLITDLGLEARGAVDGEVLVALLVTLVLLHVVEVVAADDDRARVLGRVNDATHQAAADRDVASERAILVDVLAVDRSLGGLEAETDRLPVAQAALVVDALLRLLARVLVDTSLRLVRTLGLDRDVVVTSTVVLLFTLLNHFFCVLCE